MWSARAAARSIAYPRLAATTTRSAVRATVACFDARPIDLAPADFRKYLERDDQPVLVDFWAPWCAPCRAMTPVFAEVAARFATRARFARLNTEDHPQLAAQYGIRGIPRR